MVEFDEISPREFRKELKEWHKNELAKLSVQRREANGLVTGYIDGTPTQDEAQRKWMKYLDRWGEAPFVEADAVVIDVTSEGQVAKLSEKPRRERKGGKGR